jgi:hypothetical protein
MVILPVDLYSHHTGRYYVRIGCELSVIFQIKFCVCFLRNLWEKLPACGRKNTLSLLWSKHGNDTDKDLIMLMYIKKTLEYSTNGSWKMPFWHPRWLNLVSPHRRDRCTCILRWRIIFVSFSFYVCRLVLQITSFSWLKMNLLCKYNKMEWEKDQKHSRFPSSVIW